MPIDISVNRVRSFVRDGRASEFYHYSCILTILWFGMPKNYTGIQKVLGKDRIVFRGKTGISADDPSVEAVASVELESRLPISMSLVNGEETKIYQFGPVPEAALVPPANVQEAARPPARPY
jgi:hypothetical protein